MIVAELITQAFFTSGILARGFETIDATQSYDGLRILNTILAEKSIDGNGIFYITHQNFNAVIGQEKYFIENLITVNTLTFNIGSIRYPMTRIDPNRYFGGLRADNVTSIPTIYNAERVTGGTNIYMYFKPDSAYTFSISGKFSNPSDLKLDDELSTEFEIFFTSYLQYAMAERICMFYGIPLNQDIRILLDKKETVIEQAPGSDLTFTRNNSPFGGRSLSAWTDTSHNLFNGWSP